MESLLKSLLCLKKDFPYGDNEGLTFYDPGCIESMYECQDLCGKKCINKCKMVHNPDCSRGKMAQNFLFCPMRLEKDKIKTLESIHYGLVIESHTKEELLLACETSMVKMNYQSSWDQPGWPISSCSMPIARTMLEEISLWPHLVMLRGS